MCLMNWLLYNIERSLCALQLNAGVYDLVLSHGMGHSHCPRPIGRILLRTTLRRLLRMLMMLSPSQ